MQKAFSAWIKAELRQRGLTQEEAARELGVTLSTVTRWVGGKGLPSYAQLVTIKRTWGALPPPLGS